MTHDAHGGPLRRAAARDPRLAPVLRAYEAFVAAAGPRGPTTAAEVEALVGHLNTYRDEVVYALEDRKNSGQANLRSTILEEFLYWLFRDVFRTLKQPRPDGFRIGKTIGAYVDLTFAPHSFRRVFDEPNPVVHTKDQDFAFGPEIELEVRSGGESTVSRVLLPVVAIECKTFLAKNHLDMCADTATRLRAAMPYCLYFVASEFLKMRSDVTPEFTDVAEIFVLCRAKNGERRPRRKAGLAPHPIHTDLVVEMWQMVLHHLRAIWWSPEDAVERGRIIGRPSGPT